MSHAFSFLSLRAFIVLGGVVLGFLLAGAPTASAAVLLNEDFESSSWKDKYSFTVGTCDRSTSAVKSGTYGLRSSYTVGDHYGCTASYQFPTQNQSDVWSKMWIKFSPNFGHDGTQQLIGKVGLDPKTQPSCLGGQRTEPCVSMAFAPWDRGDTVNDGKVSCAYPNCYIEGGFYYYTAVNDNNTPQYGNQIPWGNKMERDRWYCLETHMKLDSRPGAGDGAMEAWIDGTQVYSNTAMRWRDASVDPSKGMINLNFLYNYLGGSWTVDRSGISPVPYVGR